MHLHFEKNNNNNAKCDCNILSLSWMGKVPEESPEDEGWKLDSTNYYQEGWLATGNARGLVGVTFTTSHCRTRAAELPLRANYNLRGHRSEVILVKWNEPYQKLASCDSSGVIFVWIKYDGRWSIELINDRSTPVTHFSWSHDGRMALICYRDGFVLVGSVAGQRYWSSMLNDKATITCGIWTPDDQQVYFGTTAGQLIVMDVHGAMVSEVQLAAGVTSMAWSAEKFTMEEDERCDRPQKDDRNYVLAVCLADGNVVMLRSFDDVSPITIRSNLKPPLYAEWSNSRKLLAIAGTKESDVAQGSPQEYTNLLKFYSVNGTLVYTTEIPYTQCPVSALTWGHNDKRLFVATGARVHAAWVSRRVGSLQLLSRLAVRAALTRESSVPQLPLPPRLRASVAALFANTIRCTVPEPRELRRFVSRPPPGGNRLHCTMLRHAVEPVPCYTLYLEYLGGLVPLLKGRRISKIRPEFVIFDPQSQDTLHVQDDLSQCPSYSDGSDTEKDTADLCGSPRYRKKSRKRREEKPNEEAVERDEKLNDLTYVDTLPEHARLVEVTSNIWGTKFKFHGLADSIPANLGQITYRTSLLHLQPRQMTLIITELRDDVPPGPDPTFNPNLFSEDEEESYQEASSRATPETQPPPIAPMTPRSARLNHPNRPKSQISSQFMATETIATSLGKIESEYVPYVDLQEMGNLYENIRNAPPNTYRTPPRHNSPRCCDVPALQSPKNAVAPTQTLIATSNAGADYANSIQRMKNVLADQQAGIASKKEQENNKLNQISQDDKSNLTSACPMSIISMSMQNGQALNAEADDENIEKTSEQSRGVHRTSTVISISPMCSNDSIVRSCSVGYLDLVDAQLVPCDVALKMLRRDAPNKRLVLVSRKTKRRKRNKPQHDMSQPNSKPPRLRNCGKSKSLDSSDIFPSNEQITFPPQLPEHVEEAMGVTNGENTEDNAAKANESIESSKEEAREVDEKRKESNGHVVHEAHTKEKPSRLETIAPPIKDSSPSGSYVSSLDSLTARLRDFDDNNSLPPPSPRPSSRLPRSSPSSPAPSKKGKRPASASPIRRKLLSSPLLSRRMRKSRGESSDEEGLLQDDSSSTASYRDLETFQKAQLRQKLKQRGVGLSKSEAIKRDSQLVMHNKAPMWNESSQVYQLDFGGRVTQESAKNFQIEFKGRQVMQFGRIDGNAYTLDFQHPFSALQAFAVALANVTQRLK
ncbi:Tubby-related protein [Ooceraea biroi]|uniref:Tubby-related protein n=1 Tax=Ooceraea biroi TaxID=2015173 RepID=A0A026WW54_OOCBI|nr:Tubby-related protein [Ooceraea biroi]